MPHAVFVLFYPDLIPRYRLMTRALKARNWRISVITWDRTGESTLQPEQSVDDWYQVKLPISGSVPSLLISLPRFHRKAMDILQRMDRDVLLFLTHYFLLPLSRRLPSEWTCVYDASEYYAHDLSLYSGPMARWVRYLLEFFERSWVAGMAGILTVDSGGGWLRRYYEASGRPVHVLWNLPARADDPSEAQVMKAAHYCEGRPSVVYVGGLKRAKGIEIGVRAADQVRDRFPGVLFLFVGTWLEDSRTIESLVDRLGLREHVRFLPPMPYGEMLALLKSASLGIALNQRMRNYGLVGMGNGRKFFAYMQAGLPVVAPDFGKAGALLECVGCGVRVDTASECAVAQAVCAYLEDPKRALADGARGRAAFVGRYNWELESGGFLGFIQSLKMPKVRRSD